MFVTGILNAVLPGNKEALVIPKTSFLWTGKRAMVYVLKPGSDYIFSYRDIILGPEAGDYYVVAKGLNEGEEIATNGVFKIDAAAQLQGKQSMMNPEGGAVSTGMAGMPGMDMGGDKDKETVPRNESKETHPADQSMDMQVDNKFKDQLTQVYKKYLEIKDALFASDLIKAKSSAGSMHDQLDKVDMTLLKGDMHNQWMEVRV